MMLSAIHYENIIKGDPSGSLLYLFDDSYPYNFSHMIELYYVAMFFGSVFFICLGITIFYWFKFFPTLKKFDFELYERIRFRLKDFYPKDYMNYIFKQEYKSSPYYEVKKNAERLFWFGQIGQWGFNIYIVLILIVLIFR